MMHGLGRSSMFLTTRSGFFSELHFRDVKFTKTTKASLSIFFGREIQDAEVNGMKCSSSSSSSSIVTMSS